MTEVIEYLKLFRTPVFYRKLNTYGIYGLTVVIASTVGYSLSVI